MHLPFVNLGAKSQANSFDAHRFETLCLQHTLGRLSLILQIINFAMLCIIDGIKANSHDPIFRANYYSNSKKLVIRINISLS